MTCCPTCGHALPDHQLVVDLNANIVTMGGVSVRLRPRDAEVLKVLQEASPRFVTPRHIEDRVLGLEAEERCAEWVRVRISMLRRALASFPLHIVNRHGVGYQLVYGPKPEGAPDGAKQGGELSTQSARRWMLEDRQKLVEMWTLGRSAEEIGGQLGRTAASVSAQAYHVLRLPRRTKQGRPRLGVAA